MLRRWISCVAGGASTSTSGGFIPRQLLCAAQATCPGAAAHDPAAGAAHTRSTASARKHQNTAVDRPVAAVRAQLVASSAPRPPRVCTHGELSVRVRVVAAVRHHCKGAPLLRCRLIRSSDDAEGCTCRSVVRAACPLISDTVGGRSRPCPTFRGYDLGLGPQERADGAESRRGRLAHAVHCGFLCAFLPEGTCFQADRPCLVERSLLQTRERCLLQNAQSSRTSLRTC